MAMAAGPRDYIPMTLDRRSQPTPRVDGPADDESMGDIFCGPISTQPGGLFYSESMDLSNDPRFMGDTILDKRLTAFTALSLIASITSGAACDNFFPFLKVAVQYKDLHHPWILLRFCMQLLGFGLMTMVLFLNVIATMVFGLQFYYIYRLMTSGPIGFESARGYYKEPELTKYRQTAALGFILGLPMFVMGLGCMMYVRVESAVKDNDQVAHSLSLGIFVCFTTMAICLLRISIAHHTLFTKKYRQGISGLRPLLQEMEPTPRNLTPRGHSPRGTPRML